MVEFGVPLPALLLFPNEAIVPLLPIWNPTTLVNNDTLDTRIVDVTDPPPACTPFTPLLVAIESARLRITEPLLASARKPEVPFPLESLSRTVVLV